MKKISLYKVAYYYKNKYKLKTKIDILNDYTVTAYKPYIDSICLSKEYIKQRLKDKAFYARVKTKDIKKACLWALLHELRHAIDFYKGKDSFIDKVVSEQGLEHNSRSQELEADKFARQELKKWL